MVSKAALTPVVNAAEVGPISDEVFDFLGSTVEYHLKDVIQEAMKIARRSKRQQITTADINYALEMRSIEALYGYRAAGAAAAARGLDSDAAASSAAAQADRKVALMQVANVPLPKCPLEPQCLLHWLAVDGHQPRVAENPTKGGEKRRRPGSSRPGSTGGGTEIVPTGTHEMSEESRRYLDKVRAAVSGSDETARSRVFASLREDPGLQELLPYLCLYIKDRVTSCVRSKKLSQLEALITVVQCILSNPHFQQLHAYLGQIMPAVMTVLLHKKLSADPAADHWQLRNAAARLVAVLCRRYGQMFPSLQSDVVLMLGRAVKDVKTQDLTTLYGAIVCTAQLGPAAIDTVLVPLFPACKEHLDDLLKKRASVANLTEARHRSVADLEISMCYSALLHAAGMYAAYQQERLLRYMPAAALQAAASSSQQDNVKRALLQGFVSVQELFGLALRPYLQASLARASGGQPQQSSKHAFILHAPPLL